MVSVGIVGSGPSSLIPELSLYNDQIDYWIGADRGALILLEQGMKLHYALGDFDSINNTEVRKVEQHAETFISYPVEKDETDIELAIEKAYELNPKAIYLFGVSGGRTDHSLANIQLLYHIRKRYIRGIIVDQQNKIELVFPGTYTIEKEDDFPYISFIPVTQKVIGLTLTDFYYPLTDETIHFGSTRTISNKLVLNNGTFSYGRGILLIIRSRDLN